MNRSVFYGLRAQIVRFKALCVFTLLIAFILQTVSFNLLVVRADNTAQTLPFNQNWGSTGLITANDNWSGVPGIIGYRGDDLTTATATDPQTILADGSSTPVNVIANQTNTNITNGGVAEFEITDPTIALQGSGTADAPHIVINLNSTGANGIGVSYKLRDIDGTSDNAVQPVALQYRVGSSGNYTNIAAAFVADATTGPSQATQVSNVNVVLPSACDNQSLVQLRIMTTNAAGSDEWVGVDDLNISVGGDIPLSGTGAANPNNVQPANNTLLTVTVTPATNPASTGINITGNLSTIGGSAPQTFFDNGTNGDVTAGDNIFSFLYTIPQNASGGQRTLPITITDAQSRTANTNISLTIVVQPNADVHLTMGNPSSATADTSNPLNYLMMKSQYALSYHRDRGTPNWVSWHLDTTWLGSAPRQDDYRADTTLPAGWYQVQGTDYSGSGFDRGHHCPSADRTASVADNSATFLMTNFMPQAPDNNQGPWEGLESYSRTLANSGNELYIIMGGSGIGGTGNNGGITNTIANGNVTVPALTWKVIIVLPSGDNDVSRVNNSTRTIAVIMPNKQGIRSDNWQKYLATVDQVEALTGYDFFSNVGSSIQSVIESKVDITNDTAPQASNTSANTTVNVSKQITLSATDFNINSQLSFSIVSPPSNGTLGSFGTVICNNGSCSVNVTYTPNLNFTGSDQFTFKANDTALDSNTATVNISIGGPTATSTVIQGRVVNWLNSGIPNAMIKLINPVTGEERIIISSPFGYYRFTDVTVGETYIVEVTHKRYIFTSQVVTINNDTNLNFVGNYFGNSF